MLLAIVLIVLVLWLLGLIGNFTFGGAIHLLLVIALVALVLSAGTGRGRLGRLRLNANLGVLLAGVWFLLTGLLQLFNFSFEGQGLVLAVLALVAGLLMVLAR